MRPVAEVESEAALWLARRDSGELAAEEARDFEAWLNASTAHRVAFLRLRAAWSKADRLRVVDGGATPVSELIDEPDELPPRRGARRLAWSSGGLAALAATAAWLMIARVDEHSTPIGGFERVPLADGSRVELNTDTAIQVAYSRDRRQIELERGEAFFQVAKDPRRPFIVEAGDYQVVAVGTAFSVRRAEGGTEILVTEGTVRVDRRDGVRSEHPLLVHAGAHAVLGTETPVVAPVSTAQAAGDLGWREGMLVFDGQTLSEVAAEFNRYNRRQLVVDPDAGDVVIAGRFRANNLDGLLRLLELGFDIEADPRGPDRILLKYSAD